MNAREVIKIAYRADILPVHTILYHYLRGHCLGQDIDWDSVRKSHFCFDSMMFLLHMIL